MGMATERRFGCTVEQIETIGMANERRLNPELDRRHFWTMIIFKHYKLQYCSFEPGRLSFNGPRELVAEGKSYFRLCEMISERARHTAVVAEKLCSIHVPEDAHAVVIRKLFRLAETALPGVPITVHISDVTIQFLGSLSRHVNGLDLARSLWATKLISDNYDDDDEEEVGEVSQEGHSNIVLMSVGGILTASACFALQMIEAKLKINLSDRLLYFTPLLAMYASKFL